MGFGSSGTSYSSAYFGEASESILWLDNVECIGSESTLVNCGHLGLKNTRNCSHKEDAGVRCYGEQGIHYIAVYYIFNNYVLNVATHLSPSIPPCMLHSLIIDPFPDCTSDLGSYRSAHWSNPCLCAGLRAGIH